MSDRRREPGGTSTGGQFAVGAKTEPLIDMTNPYGYPLNAAAGLADRMLAGATADRAAEGTDLESYGYYTGRAQARAEVAWLLSDPDRTPDGSFFGARALLEAPAGPVDLQAPVPTRDQADHLAAYAIAQALDANAAMADSAFLSTVTGEGGPAAQAARACIYYLAVGRREAFVAAYVDLRFAHEGDLKRRDRADRLHDVLTRGEDLSLENLVDSGWDDEPDGEPVEQWEQT